MYCKPSRNAEPKRKRQLGINLFPVLVSVPLLALLAFVSFIFTNDLQRIKNLALSTSNSHLPQILAKQQMLLNVENMRRNIALVYSASDPTISRNAGITAQALIAEEDGVPRMVTTPWYDHEIPMTEAAELGTKKVMEGHCSIGIVVTTDGTITEIPREDYVQAEKRAITDMQKTGKPFLVIVNSRNPAGEAAGAVKAYLQSTFGLEPIVADCQALDAEGIGKLMKALLYTFPMSELRVHLPRWMDALEPEHPVKAALYQALLEMAEEIHTLGQAEGVLAGLRELPQVQDYSLRSVDLGSGSVICAIVFPEALFYEILSARAGMPIRSDAQLLQLLTELSQIKQEYDKISDALSAVRATGYGVVMPAAEEMKLETPEIIRKGGAYGVKLKAGAPSIHMVRVDIDTEINPMVGDEKQSQDLVNSLMGEDPEKLWQSNIFGKSVYDLIQEGLTTKLLGMPEEVRGKFRGTLTRIVNEGATGLICLIL